MRISGLDLLVNLKGIMTLCGRYFVFEDLQQVVYIVSFFMFALFILFVLLGAVYMRIIIQLTYHVSEIVEPCSWHLNCIMYVMKSLQLNM